MAPSRKPPGVGMSNPFRDLETGDKMPSCGGESLGIACRTRGGVAGRFARQQSAGLFRLRFPQAHFVMFLEGVKPRVTNDQVI
jgi:hypothetical protein